MLFYKMEREFQLYLLLSIFSIWFKVIIKQQKVILLQVFEAVFVLGW
jgi:hypothetical protein